MLGSNLEMDESRRRGEKWSGVGNFTLWASSMMDRITAHGFEDVFALELSADIKQEAWDSQKRKVCCYLRLHLSDEIRMDVLEINSVTDLWAYLEKRYHNKSSSTRMRAKEIYGLAR